MPGDHLGIERAGGGVTFYSHMVKDRLNGPRLDRPDRSGK
jgi:hypothetical protein